MGMDDFDSGGWMNNMYQFGGPPTAEYQFVGPPTAQYQFGGPPTAEYQFVGPPTAQATNMAVNDFAQPQAPAFTAPVAEPTSMAATNAATGWGGFDSGGSSPVADDSYAWYASAAPVIVDTRPMQVPNEQANPSLGSASATGGQASNPYAGQPIPTGDPYQMLTGAKLAADYQVPDWYRQSGLMLDSTPDSVRAFFQSNPQYLQDWQNITSGGKSAFATDGSTLIRSNFNNMSPEAAAYYRANPDALLAEEGFGHDPTLAYMNYFGGAGSIGANNNTQNISTYLRDNRWTPQGITAGNNPAMYARTPYGAGTASMLGTATGSTRPQAAPGGSGVPQTGGVYPQPGSGAGYQTGGVYPQPGGSSMSGSISSGPAGQNPFLTQMGDAMVGQMTQNFNRNVLPRIGSQMMASGGFGGSRQGVVEANATNDLNSQVGNALTNLYGAGYNTALNYDLGLRNNATAYDLGLRNNQLGYANLDRGINNDNLNWQLQGANFGLGLQDRLMGYGQLGLWLGTQINDSAYQNWLRFSQGANSLANGYGTSTGTMTQPGNVLGGALGGAQLGSRIGNWWGGGVNNNLITNGNSTTGVAD